ncbi:hypothetical protein A7982_12515 [Minicystis rosea]|nr:hypothetical protein A7982_12515 [Minicystis rosea]
MTNGCVTLDEVFGAASVRAASLVSETSGYLALAIGDATSRLPFAIDERAVMLTTEGNVGITKRGEMLPPKQAAAGLRQILARLLAASTGTTMPALATAGRAREESDRGVDAVVDEIEAALIPVNRAAARRALARLARETIKAKEQGKLRRSAARPPEAAPKVEAPKPEAPKPTIPVIRVEVQKVVAPKVGAPTVGAQTVGAQTISPEPVAAPPHAVALDHTPAPQLVHEATTPPPVEPVLRRAETREASIAIDAAPITSVIDAPAAPVVALADAVAAAIAPTATPAPSEVFAIFEPIVETRPLVVLPTPPPVPVVLTPMPASVMAEPTPTVLGMGVVEIDGPVPELASTAMIDALAATINAPPSCRTPAPAMPVRWTPTPPPMAAALRTPAPVAVEPHEDEHTILAPPVEMIVAPPMEALEAPAIEIIVEPPIEALDAPPVEMVVAPPIEALDAPAIEIIVAPPIEALDAPAIEVIAAPAVERVVEPPVEVIEALPIVAICEESTLDAQVEESVPAPVRTAPMPAVMAEPDVIAQPTEPAELAFEIEARAPRPPADPMTPPFALAPSALAREVSAPPSEARVVAAQQALPEARLPSDENEPRMPAVRPVAIEARPVAIIEQAPVRTRADDLLASFTASCGDDASMREAAASLRRIAGIEATPLPDAVVLDPIAERKPIESAATLPFDEPRVEEALPVRAPRRRSFPSFAVTLLVLFLGVAGGGALVRLRPDLFGVGRPADTQPPAAQPITPKAAPPATTADPRGAQAPTTTIDGAHASAR